MRVVDGGRKAPRLYGIGQDKRQRIPLDSLLLGEQLPEMVSISARRHGIPLAKPVTTSVFTGARTSRLGWCSTQQARRAGTTIDVVTGDRDGNPIFDLRQEITAFRARRGTGRRVEAGVDMPGSRPKHREQAGHPCTGLWRCLRPLPSASQPCRRCRT